MNSTKKRSRLGRLREWAAWHWHYSLVGGWFRWTDWLLGPWRTSRLVRDSVLSLEREMTRLTRRMEGYADDAFRYTSHVHEDVLEASHDLWWLERRVDELTGESTESWRREAFEPSQGELAAVGGFFDAE